jgi:subtilisin family serine protease
LAVRVLDGEGSGSFEDVALGIRWAADHGADVINLSLGAVPGAQAFVITGLLTDVADAIQYANGKGVVVVAAAGNESAPLCDTPGFDPGALCVTATDKREVRAWYSNDPVRPDLQSVAAPGGAATLVLCNEDVVSTVPPGTGPDSCGLPANKAYDEYAGTSMATPHVAGVAGLLASLGCTRQGILSAMTSTARNPITGLRGSWTPDYGYGIVDAGAAVNAAGTVC